MLLQAHEFVGDVQRRQYGDAQGINRITVCGYGTHLGIDSFGKLLNVLRIVRPKMIGLIVNLYADRGTRPPDFQFTFCHVSPLCAQFVNMLEQTLDAHAHRFPLFLQACELLFQLGNLCGLFFDTM